MQLLMLRDTLGSIGHHPLNRRRWIVGTTPLQACADEVIDRLEIMKAAIINQ